jgi:hypothetical protein
MSQEVFSAEELAGVTARNRLITDPFPRRMVARDQANQGAAVILASVDKARELGVPEEKWVYLHGGADVAERTEDGGDVEGLAEAEGEHVLLHERDARAPRPRGDGRGGRARTREHAEAEVDADDELAAERPQHVEPRAGAAAEVEPAGDAARLAEHRRHGVEEPYRCAEWRPVELRRQ